MSDSPFTIMDAGWYMQLNAAKQHYFKKNTIVSLCGRDRADYPYWWGANDDSGYVDHLDCMICRRRLARDEDR